MPKITLLVVVIMAVAQIIPSCGAGESTEVVGWVEAKGVDPFNRAFTITINSTEYEVPGYFWQRVEVGDLVKWDGVAWTIVKKANQPAGFLRPVPDL